MHPGASLGNMKLSNKPPNPPFFCVDELNVGVQDHSAVSQFNIKSISWLFISSCKQTQVNKTEQLSQSSLTEWTARHETWQPANRKSTEGPRISSDYFQYGQKQKREETNLSRVKGQKVPFHLLPHAGFFVVVVSLLYGAHLSNYHWFPLRLLLYYMHSERWYWNFWLVLIFIERSPSSLFLFALSPLPFIFLCLSLCQLSALAECHTGACRSASDRCSSSQAKRRKGTRVKTESDWKRTRDRERKRKKEGRRVREEEEWVRQQSWSSPLCQKGHGAGLGHGQ